MSSFAIPLSGLNAAQKQLNAVSNNLANMNTTGFKDQTVNFADLFAESYAVHTNGSGNPLQTGLGVKVSSVDSDFTEGSLNETGTESNMALSGSGFFVTKDGQGIQDYTRAGNFTPNKAGQLTTPEGNLVMGYPAVAGVVNTSAPLQAIQVGAQTTPAVATKNFQITANLSSNAAAGETGVPSNFSIYDSLGQAHNVSIAYTKTGTNTWSYNVTIPSADFTSGASGSTTLATGTLSFNSSGQLQTTSGKSISITLPPAGSTFADGAASQSMNWNLTDASGSPTLTQTATASGTSATNQDGYASGTLSGYTIDPDGTVQGAFTSGKTLALGQIAIATFANVEGLSNIGGNSYRSSPSSGDAVVGAAQTGGRGSVIGGYVEASNVDISTEFSKLIIAQQAYSANAKSITAFNQVSQATIAMIQ